MVMRSNGSLADSLTVKVRTWEPNHGGDVPGFNTTELYHDVTFAPGSNVATVQVVAKQDVRIDPPVDTSNPWPHTLNAEVAAATDSSNELGTPSSAFIAIVDINATPYPLPLITIQNSGTPLAVTEGNDATFTLSRTGGDLTQPQTVGIRENDPDGYLRGNHWDPPAEYPTQVTFAANQNAKNLKLTIPDDQRDRPDGSFRVHVLPSFDYAFGVIVGGDGVSLSRRANVTDNDTPQELELNFGKDGVNDADADEGDELGIVVKRRQQDADTGTTASFTVRVETNRSGDDYVLEDWTEDTANSRLFKDFPLQITGSDLEVEETLLIPDDGESETNWRYWASIRTLEDYEGNDLTTTEEAMYWTVKSGFRETRIDATDSGASSGTVTLTTDQTNAVEGGETVFKLTRVGGPVSQTVTAQVKTWESNREPNTGVNPSSQIHNVTIQSWETIAKFSVYPYVDGVEETDTDALNAIIETLSSPYTMGSPFGASIEINDPPSGSAFVTLSVTPSSVAEGDAATFTFTRSGGDTTAPLTVNIRVDDPEDFLRGSHWDTEPDFPTTVEFAANFTTQTMTVTVPDDQRDLGVPRENAGYVTVNVLPSSDYLLGNTGQGTSAEVVVTDNDDAQEFTFDWGYVDYEDSWGQGESWLYQQGSVWVSGPAEGLFYYNNDRTWRFDHGADEYFPIHFQVKRRSQDKGKTATFVVRVEHNRGWVHPRHSATDGWSTDPETGWCYKDYPITLEGNQQQVMGRIEILDNGLPDPEGWSYRASIRQIEDVNGVTLSADQEAKYWTVDGVRSRHSDPFGRGYPEVTLERVDPHMVDEGQYIRYRVFHDGHTERSVETELRQSEEGSAVMDSAGGDFNRMLPAGASGSTVTVLAEARDGNDGDAVFTVVLLPGTGYTIDPAYASAQAIVRDADPLPVLGFRDLAVTVNEAVGTVEFHVDLVSLLPSLRTVTVDYEVSEDRTDDGADLVGTTGTLTFAPGETSAAIEVTVVQDLIAEPNEGFTVSLSNPVYAELQDRQTSLRARGVILDDEPTVTLEVTDTTVDEGADVVVTLTRTGDTSRELTAWLRIVEQGSITYPAVTFSVGFGTATHTITTEDDHEALGTYDLNIGVAHPVNDIGETNTYHRSEGEVTITVRDDDLPTVWIETTDPDGSPGNGNPYPQVTIPRRIYEGDGMHFILKRQRRGPELTINLEGTGASSFITATLPTTVTMAQGETSARIHIPTYDDAVSEIHGEFTLTVKDGTGYRPGDPESADHWIYDDDTTGQPKLRISGEKDWVNEGEDVVFTLQRTGDTQASLEANLLIIKTKSNEQCMLDQTMRDRTVTFAAGSDTATVTITTEDDDRNRGDNTVVAAIGLGVYLIDDSTPNVDEDIVWIQDDDRTTVTLTPATDEFEEGTQMRVTLDRTGHPSPLLWVETMVEVTVLHPDSAKEQTFSFTAPFTRIDQGESSTTSQYGSARRVEALGATGRIWFEQKACIDSPGSVSAGGCGYGAQYLRGSQYEQDFTIYNPFMGVRIEADQTTVGEGNTATFTLHRHGGKTDSLTRTLQVRVQVTQEGDYISGSTPQTVTFAANQSAATLSVPTSQDSVDEADGSIKVKLLPPASRTDDQYAYEIGEYRGTPWTVTEVTSGVTDDDYVFPTMSVDDPTALESDGSIEFTVSLDRANYEEAVTVN